MKTKKKKKTAVCPRCGKTYTGHPALSRADNKTLICPDCGVTEALEGIGVSPEEQKHILDILHSLGKD